MTKILNSLTFLILLCSTALHAQEVSRSFELRYFTPDAKANGSTDFKGETEYFNTNQRIEYLNRYAQYAKQYFQDTALNTVVVKDEEAENALNKIKPQPLPTVRKRIPLDNWQYLGYREGQHDAKQHQLGRWQGREDVQLTNGHLIFTQPQKLSWQFAPQSWLSTLRWKAKWPQTNQTTRFLLTDDGGNAAAIVGITPQGKLYYHSAGDTVFTNITLPPNQWHSFRLETDLSAFKRKEEVQRYNLYVNENLVADYVPIERVGLRDLGYAENFSSLSQITTFTAKGTKGLQLDDLWGIGYHPTGRESYPYTVATFVDEDFEAKPAISDWQQMTYSDSAWQLPVSEEGYYVIEYEVQQF